MFMFVSNPAIPPAFNATSETMVLLEDLQIVWDHATGVFNIGRMEFEHQHYLHTGGPLSATISSSVLPTKHCCIHTL